MTPELFLRLRNALASEQVTLKVVSVFAPVTAALYFLAGPDSWWVLVGTAVCLSLLALASFHWLDATLKVLRTKVIDDWATNLTVS